MNKKVLVSVGGVVLCFTAFISFFGIIKPTPISQKPIEKSVQKNHLKIAVVNEDSGTVYNGETVNMAKTLLTAFSNQSEYVIEEVSRAIAERGLDNQTYQLMIILPSKFSEDSLALESSNPTKAVFQYHIKSDKPLVVKQAEEAVLNFKSVFNKNLVNIYFLSIIGNLQTAQTQMYDVISNEGEALNSYQSNLSNTLTSYSTRFKGLSTTPHDLLSQYSLFDKELNQSNDAFTSIVNIDKTYETEIDKVKVLQEAWRHAIDEKGNGLAQYDESVSQLTVHQQLESLKTLQTYFNENFREPRIWRENAEKGDKFNKELTTLIAALKTLNDQIDTTLEQYHTKISQAIEESLNNTSGVSEEAQQIQMTLGRYIKQIRETLLSKLDSALYYGVFYDNDTLEQLGLSKQDTHYLKNINAFISWYTTENKKSPVTTHKETHISQYMKQLKHSAMTNLEQSRTLNISEIEGTVKDIRVTVPSEYLLHVEGYGQTKIDDVTYRLEVKDAHAKDIKIHYKLTPLHDDSLSLFDVVQVKVEVTTEEQLETITGETTTETRTEHPSTDNSHDMVSGQARTLTIIKDKTKPKVITRVYTQMNNVSNLSAYQPYEEAQSFYQDMKHYLEIAALAKAFYDIDLHHAFEEAPSSSLFKQTDVDHLKSIITALIKDATITTLKKDLKVSDEQLKQFEALALNATDLNTKLDELRKSTSDSSTQLQAILDEAEKIQKTLQEKPVFTEYKAEDNTDLVTVSMDMNKDLMQLMASSRTLMDNTKANQEVSKSIHSTLDKLSHDVSTLEKEGEDLSDRVADLQHVMSEKYTSNQEFLKGFSTVLKNTKTGNRTNEAVYEYLSNPVEASKIQGVLGIIQPKAETTRQDSRSGLLIVLIGYLVSLSIAYLLQHADIAALQKRLNVLKRVDWKNAIQSLLFLTGLGGLAGLFMGMVAAYKLSMAWGQGALFSVIIVAMVLTFTYGLNLLLSKVKSLGFLIAIGLLLLYMITATQLLDTYYVNASSFLTSVSPLTYVENSIGAYINQTNSGGILLVVLIALSIIFGLINGFIYRTIKTESSEG
ncbi:MULTISPECIES: type VII secretion protein EsaA [unclassified Granulicatella]|uniref:type VII secretion protein EsaA n=1 Tax=unclassified Granulicatella TaxID=2630493 RepID=UPI00107455AF|nr:type VII secretion protein EsaA [Granulicatella sp. WM01]MBF0780481.1 type VII secretion protein EsaA [Granulicatella sp. 19428wC4_WM01]TFU95380.1 type VII secretion protein EsaA [Granulicatella sp. WM01]